MEHKSLNGYLVNSPIRFPHCYVRCVDGEFYTCDMRQISLHEAVEACSGQDCLILKDAQETSGGQSVEKLDLSSASDAEKAEKLTKVFAQRSRNDFVVQECLRQHPSTAAFNPTSVNTFRVTTLYLNGRFSVLSIIFRMGKDGMKVDNWGGGWHYCRCSPGWANGCPWI